MAGITTYENVGIYIDNATTLEQRIQRMDAVIDALETSALTSATSQHIQEYWLDDGQSKIKTTYRSIEEINAAITAFEGIRQRYINRLNKRVFNMRDAKSIRYYNGRTIY